MKWNRNGVTLSVLSLLGLLSAMLWSSPRIGHAGTSYNLGRTEFGMLNPQIPQTVAVNWINSTGNSLRVTEARGTCPCLRVECSPSVVEPGEQVCITLELTISGQSDSVAYAYYVKFDTGVVVVGGVRGSLRMAPRATPSNVVANVNRDDGRFEADVQILTTRQQVPSHISLERVDPQLDVAIVQQAVDFHQANDSEVHSVRLAGIADPRIANGDYKLTFRADSNGSTAEVILLLHLNVISPLTVSPSKLFFVRAGEPYGTIAVGSTVDPLTEALEFRTEPEGVAELRWDVDAAVLTVFPSESAPTAFDIVISNSNEYVVVPCAILHKAF